MAPLRVTLAGIVILGVWAAGAVAQSTSCDPSCPVDCVPGTNVPNPRNCAQYYTCLEDCTPSDPAFECAEGHLFDVVTAQCQPDAGGVTCGYCLPQCSYTCDGDTELAADRGDCGVALFCGLTPPPTITCPTDNPYFDGTQCQGNQTQCCDPCEVFCEAAFTEVMDPASCSHFYYCAQVGYPLPEDRFQCGDGEVFLDGHCRESDDPQDCYQPCAPASPSPSPTASTTEYTTVYTISSSSAYVDLDEAA
ncbi:uncharacterized protein LOC126987133 isoform X2 [Eriocheir sinensis]|uniref:uncharacterized protein LOC126987133 isoform X2 n=1 Tax=Eriocheir sinensis TaxID=95602 RepID=UPI0021CA5DCA|nr:uncharacterized protein LOC126987133 isoform X2 [Eriocheir sinensis]